MVKILPYNPALKERAKELRKNMTFGETLLWNKIRNHQMLGFDFDRQRCIDNYIVDFYCKDLMLAIEIDGQSHDSPEAFAKDQARQNVLEKLGVCVIRFAEAQVKYDMVNVLLGLETTIIELVKGIPDLILPVGFDLNLLA